MTDQNYTFGRPRKLTWDTPGLSQYQIYYLRARDKMDNKAPACEAKHLSLDDPTLTQTQRKSLKYRKEKMDRAIDSIKPEDEKKKFKELENLLFSLKRQGYNLEDLASQELKVKHTINLGYIAWLEGNLEEAIYEGEGLCNIRFW